MSLTGVADFVGNAISSPLTWSFVMQDFRIQNTSVQVSGLLLSIPYSNNIATQLAVNITSAFSQLLSISSSRIQNLAFAPSLDGQTQGRSPRNLLLFFCFDIHFKSHFRSLSQLHRLL